MGAVLDPIATVGVGILIFRLSARWELVRARSDRVMQRKIQSIDVLAPRANEIYCFLRRVGYWRELTPQAVLAAKRAADKEYYANTFLFGASMFIAYEAFMNAAFRVYQGAATDAKIRADVQRYLQAGMDCDPAAFESDVVALTELDALYRRLRNAMASELDIIEKS